MRRGCSEASFSPVVSPANSAKWHKYFIGHRETAETYRTNMHPGDVLLRATVQTTDNKKQPQNKKMWYFKYCLGIPKVSLREFPTKMETTYFQYNFTHNTMRFSFGGFRSLCVMKRAKPKLLSAPELNLIKCRGQGHSVGKDAGETAALLCLKLQTWSLLWSGLSGQVPLHTHTHTHTHRAQLQ